MKSIGIVVPYFGEFPEYFHLWLRSAEMNPSIDFLIFTDQPTTECAENIHFYRSTLEEIHTRIKNKLGKGCKLKQAYKLCDYRPAYGMIFEAELKGFDFWGYCDVDVIFGDLRKFITESVLEEYEKISNWGHLTLYRNSEEVVHKFKLINTAASFSAYEAFRIAQNVAFDEKAGVSMFTNEGHYETWIDKIVIADIFPDTYHFRTYYNFYSDTYHIYEFDQGKLFGYFVNGKELEKCEFMYIHLQARKMSVETINTDNYLITPSGFKEKHIIDVETVERENQIEEGKSNIKLKKIPPVQIPAYIFFLRKARLFFFKHILPYKRSH